MPRSRRTSLPALDTAWANNWVAGTVITGSRWWGPRTIADFDGDMVVLRVPNGKQTYLAWVATFPPDVSEVRS